MKAADHVFELHYNAALLEHRQGDLQEAVSQVRCWLQLAAALHSDATSSGGVHHAYMWWRRASCHDVV